MRLSLITAAFIFAMPLMANAETCSHYNSVYTDGGRYEIYLSHEKVQPSTMYDIVLKDLETDRTFPGQILYGNGYSIPKISFQIKCTEEQKEVRKPDQDQEYCGHYSGTVYTIDGLKTTYGFSNDKPMLFPELGFQLYHAWGVAGAFPVPNDVWTFKNCRN